MSFTELLEAAKALPREEQDQLIDAIRDESPERRLVDRIFGKSFPSHGAQFQVWFPEHQPDAVQAMHRAMNGDGSEVI